MDQVHVGFMMDSLKKEHVGIVIHCIQLILVLEYKNDNALLYEQQLWWSGSSGNSYNENLYNENWVNLLNCYII